MSVRALRNGATILEHLLSQNFTPQNVEYSKGGFGNRENGEEITLNSTDGHWRYGIQRTFGNDPFNPQQTIYLSRYGNQSQGSLHGIALFGKSECEETLLCAPEEGPILSNEGVKEIYTAEEADFFDAFAWETGVTSAAYYNSIVEYHYRSGGQGRLLHGRDLWFDETGEVTEHRSIYLKTKFDDLKERWEAWKSAQDCSWADQVASTTTSAKVFLGFSNNAVQCFEPETAPNDDFRLTGNFYKSKKRYDPKLIGTKEPEKPVGVTDIVLVDRGNDGKTDYAKADWTGTRFGYGQFDVNGRTDYTGGILGQLDGHWKNFRADSDVYHTEAAPADVFVKRCDRVIQWDPLFAYHNRQTGKIETVRAEASGQIAQLQSAQRLWLVLGRNDRKSEGFWVKNACKD